MIKLPYLSSNLTNEDFLAKVSEENKIDTNINDLCEFFDHENLSLNKRLSKLRKMGGVSGLQNILKINTRNGINPDDIGDYTSRVLKFGDNLKAEKNKINMWKIISLYLKDRILLILLLVAFIYSLTGVFSSNFTAGYTEGAAILISVLFNSTCLVITTYLKCKKFFYLMSVMEYREVRVVRNGKIRNIPSTELVVGDVLFVGNGDILNVDGILFKAYDLLCDESSLSFEKIKDFVYKKVPYKYSDEERADPFLFTGSKIVEGRGEMIVCAVGNNTYINKRNFNSLEREADLIYMSKETKLTKKLSYVANESSRICIIIAILSFIALSSHFFWNISNEDEWFNINNLRVFLNNLLETLAMLIVIVPEGLNLSVSSAMVYALTKLKEQGNLVRYFSACETLGYVNNILTDKTGTLTKNKMTAACFFICEQTYYGKKDTENIKDSIKKIFCQGICINSTAYPKFTGNGEAQHIGDETECALLELAFKLSFNYESYRPSEKIKKTIAFTPMRKRMSTIYQISEYNYHLYCKGDPFVLLDRCSYYHTYKGTKVQMNEEFQDYLKKSVIGEFSRQHLRSILLAFKEISSNCYQSRFEDISEESLESDLIFIGLVGIKDPLRDDIPEAVALCSMAGITVRIVTGDSAETAIAIAKDCGILPKDYNFHMSNGYSVMEGKDFKKEVGVIVDPYKPNGENLTIRDNIIFEEISRELRVLVRSTSEDKYLLVNGLRMIDNVVALSGNSSNDVIALKMADVGFAMGVCGSDIAKSVCDVILMDDNFSSIVGAIKWGRSTIENIRKFLQFNLILVLSFSFICLLVGIIYGKNPFAVTHMIFINTYLNTLVVFALSTEDPTDDILLRGPFSPKEYILTSVMRGTVILCFCYNIFVSMIFIFYFNDIFDLSNLANDSIIESKKHTLFFCFFVYLIVFTQFTCRRVNKNEINFLRNITSNFTFIFVQILIVSSLIAVIHYGGDNLNCISLSIHEHLICLGFSAGILVVGIIAKLISDNIFKNSNFLQEKKIK